MSWWVAQLQPRPDRARVAVGHLRLFGFEVYNPRTLERRKNHARYVTVEQPLFPGYLFIAVTVTRQWHAANTAPGVLHVVRTGFTPAVLHDDVVASIRQRERDGLVRLPERHLVSGAPVCILAGPFANHLAIYAGMNGHERVAVLLHVLGAHQRVTLPAADVEPAG
jgi:transcriptional antiterminator RfaH